MAQHPLRVESSGDEFTVRQLLAASPKLRSVIELLRPIRAIGEKTIVLQRMLARVVSEEFGISVPTLNGDTPRATGLRNTAIKGRSQILTEFDKTEGFQAVILSPFVAGVVHTHRGEEE